MYCIHIQNIQFIDWSFISKITSANAVFIFILFYNLVCFILHHHSVLLKLSCSLKWLKINRFLNSMVFVIRLRKLSNKPWHIFFYYSFQKIAIWNILHRDISLFFWYQIARVTYPNPTYEQKPPNKDNTVTERRPMLNEITLSWTERPLALIYFDIPKGGLSSVLSTTPATRSITDGDWVRLAYRVLDISSYFGLFCRDTVLLFVLQ